MNIDIDKELAAAVRAHEQGDLDAAEAAYSRILAVAPGHADARHLCGVIAFQRGDMTLARAYVETAIQNYPQAPLYHANLGRILRAMNENTQAVAAYREAIRLNPNDAALHSDLSAALLADGDTDGARARAHLAIELDRKCAAAYLNLGLALQGLRGDGDEEAEAALRTALTLDASMPGTMLALGLLHQAREELDDATNAYQAAVQLDPTFTLAHINLGNIARSRGKLEQAAEHFQSAFELDPMDAAVLSNNAVVAQEFGEIERAIELYDAALVSAPDDAEVRRNRGMALLSIGQYQQGWIDFDERLNTEHLRPYQRDWPVPAWRGEHLQSKTIYVHAEQGFGDTIQFCRFLPQLKEQGARVFFECADVLHSLFSSFSGVDKVCKPGDPIPDVDFHCALLSLPRWLDIDTDRIPAKIPYLSAPRSVLKAAEAWMAPVPTGKRLGIAWRGNPDHINDHARSPGLAPFLSISNMPDAVLVSLQKEHAADELNRLAGATAIHDLTDKLESFADTAALIKQLDVVVSCDTSVLHLAGALGKPAFAILPHVAEWRWGVSNDRTPWYPTMRLCRQQRPGDWASAIECALDELRD